MKSIIKDKIILLILIFAFVNTAFSNYEVNKVFIRVKAPINSKDYTILEQLKNNIKIKDLENIIPDYKINRFVGDELLAPNSKIKYDENDFQTVNITIDKLARTYILEFSGKYDAVILSHKLNKLEFIELAEPVPVSKIVNLPNDPELQKQYYLSVIKALDASDLISSNDTIIVGIVDTGIDLEHEDIKENLFLNYGEIGFDENGNDKSSNNIDDDANGFVDDFQGWDFLTYNGTIKGDNDPLPGNAHGTHVGGTVGAVTNNKIGIAGVAKNVKLIPIKVAPDQYYSTNTVNPYHGVLYAAKMGARIINCSWGSPSFSESEKLILDLVSKYNCLVVCAAGNEGKNELYYPGMYPTHLCVAASSISNNPASFTNYGEEVTLTAPGSSIFATIPDNSYSNMSGTSMASPIVAGCAAMLALKFPDYSPEDIKRHLQATADNSIYGNNPKFRGYLGSGIVNLLNAVKEQNPKFVILDKYNIYTNGKEDIKIGDSIFVDINLINYFSELENLIIEISPKDSITMSVLSDNSIKYKIEKMQSKEKISLNKIINSKIINDPPLDLKLNLLINIVYNNDTISQYVASTHLNKSYINNYANKISTTINSKGNIGFNDFPKNNQGIGFYYDESDNLLFEGAIILARKFSDESNSSFNLWNMARTENGAHSDEFNIIKRIQKTEYPEYTVLSAEYETKNLDEVKDVKYLNSLEFNNMNDKYRIVQNVYFFNSEEDKDYMISEYKIKNLDSKDYDSLYLGLFLDWDHSTYTNSSTAMFDIDHNYSIVGLFDGYFNSYYTGSKLLTSQKYNYFPILNSSLNFGIYDGFTNEEKVITISNGTKKLVSESNGDVSEVTAAGPFSLESGEEITIAISIFANKEGKKLKDISERSTHYLDRISIITEDNSFNKFLHYPNPINNGKAILKLYLEKDELLNIILYDNNGKFIKELGYNVAFSQGNNEFQVELGEIHSGNYFIILKNESKYFINKITIAK